MMKDTIVHMCKGNRNFSKGTFKSLCSAIPIKEDYAVMASHSLEQTNCKECLMVFISLKEEEILKAEKKIGLRK